MQFNAKNLVELIENGENSRVEFKLKFSEYEKIAKEAIAFANTNGGYIIFGVSDEKKIVGVPSEKEIIELFIKVNSDFCEPKLETKTHFVEVKKKELVIIEVMKSGNKPVRLKDGNIEISATSAQVYIRINDKSIPASPNKIRLIIAENEKKELYKYTITETEKEIFRYLTTNSNITIQQAIEFLSCNERKASRALLKLVRAGILDLITEENGNEYYQNKNG